MLSILFVLPVGGGSGGAHSVMAEAEAMWRLGVPATVATNAGNADRLRDSYRDLKSVSRQILSYEGPADLGSLIEEVSPTFVVATTNQSVHVLAEAVERSPGARAARLAYYVQDYEPLFYAKGSDDWLLAYSSYGRLPKAVHFAKTRWLQEVVEANHGVQVHKVEASVDHRLFYPQLSERLAGRERLVVAGMVRPTTPRRAPRRTARILNHVAKAHSTRVVCVSFGCGMEELAEPALKLEKVEHLGLLGREQVGELFRRVDLFLDLSDFQAFGRTAIEAMSCGAAALVPAHGGAYEFALDGRNGFIVDTRDDGSILRAVDAFVGMTAAERRQMSLAAVATGYRYDADRAALSEIELFLEA